MIEFLVISTISTLIGYFFIWIDLYRLTLLPLFFILVFIVTSLGWISVWSFTKEQIKNHGALLSWWVIIIGITTLLINQWLVRYHVISITVIINIILYISSYQWDYHEGKEIFLGWLAISFLIALIYTLWTQQYHLLAIIISIASVLFLWLLHILFYLFPSLDQKDITIIIHQQEFALYACLGVILYRIFQPNYNAIVVSQLAFITLCIGVRQTYLTRQQEIKHEKKSWLSGRSLLAWQKVLEWYDDQNKAFDLHLFNFLIQKWYMPSHYGMKILQYAQIALIIILVWISIRGLFNHTGQTLLRYRLGILCFIITLFGINSQEKFIKYYKTIAIGLITGSYYITLFDSIGHSSTFTWGSLIWLCLNMICCLFYEDIFPKSKDIFTKKDILFWLSMIIIGSIITTLSLISLPLNWSILFALWCIIIGMVSYFSYHIWKKIN